MSYDDSATTLNGAAIGGGIRVSRFLKDLALTTVTSLVTIAALLLVTKVLAARLGPEGFGAYMLSRRVLATLDPVSTFSMAIALTRFAALAGGDAERNRVLVGGASLALAAGALCCAVAFLFPGTLARLVFADARYDQLVMATGLMVLAYSFFIVLYAWYRGIDRMGLANLWQLGAIAVGPVVAAWLVAGPGREAPVVTAFAAILVLSAVPLTGWVVRALRTERPFDPATIRAMVRYAAPRVPGGLAFGGLLAVGPVLAPHLVSLAAVGYVAAGQALLRVVEGATEAFGRVALPKIAQLSAAGQDALLRERVADVAAVVIHIGVFATLHLWLWAPELVRLWLGQEYDGAIPSVRFIVLGVLPYLLFVTLRSVLDALEVRAVNATNLYAAIAVTVVAAWLLARPLEAAGLALATSLGLTLLGALTVVALRRRCAFPFAPIMMRKVLLLNAVLALAAAAARQGALAGGLPPAAAAVGIVMLAATAYLGALWRLDARWIGELKRRVDVKAA